LIERTEGVTGERSYSYKPTLKLLEYLGVSRMEDLPEHQTMAKKIEQFMEAVHTQDHE
jgi:chromosome segregation and condensation protein ScpB